MLGIRGLGMFRGWGLGTLDSGCLGLRAQELGISRGERCLVV